jgi:hypothetical protein
LEGVGQVFAKQCFFQPVEKKFTLGQELTVECSSVFISQKGTNRGLNNVWGIPSVGYTKCWDDAEFRKDAMRLMESDEVLVPEQDTQEVAMNEGWDYQDDVMVQLGDMSADSATQQAFYEAV